jgi:hypothetical protein
MVGPSMTDEEYESGLMRLRAGFVALVGVSAALVALSSGAGLAVAAAALVGGLALGGALVWYLGWILPSTG